LGGGKAGLIGGVLEGKLGVGSWGVLGPVKDYGEKGVINISYMCLPLDRSLLTTSSAGEPVRRQ